MLVAVGLNQRCAAAGARELLAVAPDELAARVRGYAALSGVDEIAMVSTCCRVEIYAASGCPAAAVPALRQALAERAGGGFSLLELQGDEALRHLARVASSLESAVLGEPQILGQVREALARAQEAGVAGKELTAAFQRAFEIAKRIRTETAIGRAAVSWGSAAATLAEKVLGPLPGRRAVILGAGEMARLASQHFRGQGADVVILNRTPSRARALAAEVGAGAAPLEALEAELPRADVVVSAAPAAPAALAPGPVAALMKARRGRRLVLVDFAMPRAVAEATGELPGVFLCDVDGLSRLSHASLADRSAAVAAAERIREAEMARASREDAERRAAPLIQAMRTRASAIADEEVARTVRRLGDDPEVQSRLSAMAGAIVSKLFHAPSARLRRAGADGDPGEALLAAARRIFDVSSDVRPPRQR